MDDTLYQNLLNSGFRFVSYRPRSEKETRDFLERKLKRKKIFFDPRVLEKVIARLKELKYLDDVKFVIWWIEQRSIHKPKGTRLIAQELKAKGIDRALIEEMVLSKDEQLTSDRKFINRVHSEADLAKKAVEKKLDRWKTLPNREQKKKIYGFLGRRGFDSETIDRVIDEISSFEVK